MTGTLTLRQRLVSRRRDRARWVLARDWAGLGELVVAWLHGEAGRLPAHDGPPYEETISLGAVLTDVNRAGFVTDNSQMADPSGHPWERQAWVCGFVPADALPGLRDAAGRAHVLVTSCCRGRSHLHDRRFRGCPGRGSRGEWADRCPAVADEIWDAWYVTLADPEPGRNDRLWPALAGWARSRRH